MKVHKAGNWTYWGVKMPLCIPNRRYMASFPPIAWQWKEVTCKRCLAIAERAHAKED